MATGSSRHAFSTPWTRRRTALPTLPSPRPECGAAGRSGRPTDEQGTRSEPSDPPARGIARRPLGRCPPTSWPGQAARPLREELRTAWGAEVFFHFWSERDRRTRSRQDPTTRSNRGARLRGNEAGRKSVFNTILDRCPGIESADQRQSTGRQFGYHRQARSRTERPPAPPARGTRLALLPWRIDGTRVATG